MPEKTPDQALNTATNDAEAYTGPPREVRDIVLRLQIPIINPVARARHWVEMEVPEARRGPGWDRHWRELEAYAESIGNWSIGPE